MMKPLNSYIDATLLKPDATTSEVAGFVNEAIKYQFHTVCVHITRIPQVFELIKTSGSKLTISGTVGFPFGNLPIETKILEAQLSIAYGASEIDFVINIGAVKDHNWTYVNQELHQMRQHCQNIILKVILETCLLTQAEIVQVCQLAAANQLDFVKTSTGFAQVGATVEAVRLMKTTVKNQCLIKASGGIKTKAFTLALIEAGADRIGTSNGVIICNE